MSTSGEEIQPAKAEFLLRKVVTLIAFLRENNIVWRRDTDAIAAEITALLDTPLAADRPTKTAAIFKKHSAELKQAKGYSMSFEQLADLVERQYEEMAKHAKALEAAASADRPPVEHPEARCEDCGGPNVTWFAPSEIWNKAAGSGNGILCPVCFVRKAEAAGIQPTAWKIAPEEHAVASSGRRSNAEMLENYAESYDRCRFVSGGSVAYDIRHNMIPALVETVSASEPSEDKDTRILELHSQLHHSLQNTDEAIEHFENFAGQIIEWCGEAVAHFSQSTDDAEAEHRWSERARLVRKLLEPPAEETPDATEGRDA